MTEPTQERRTARVASAVTEMEREALGEVAKLRGITISQLLHEMSVADVVAEYRRMVSDLAA